MRERHVHTHKEASLMGCQHSEISKMPGRFSFLFVLALHLWSSQLQQSNYPICQSCLKKNALCVPLSFLPFGCLLLPDQIRRNQKPKLPPTLKLPAAPVPTWGRLCDKLGTMASGQASDRCSMPWQGVCVFSLSLWTSSLWWPPLQSPVSSPIVFKCPEYTSVWIFVEYLW